MTFRLAIALCLCSLMAGTEPRDDLAAKRTDHKPMEIEDHRLSVLSRMSDLPKFSNILDNILVPRVVGTPGHDKVHSFIVDFLKALDWNVYIDSFDEATPNLGVLRFRNIVGTLNPNAERYLVLACHYDSKLFPNAEFLGATDSAVPCAMLLDLASVMKEQLSTNRNNADVSLKLVFFDGEEAFQQWTAQDSIYGARHLAKKWEEEGMLSRIDMLVLLDLLGSPDPQFYSFFRNTESWYLRFIYAEDRLASGNHLDRYTSSSVSTVSRGEQRYFQPHSIGSHIEDDHIPFLERNVPIIHLIPNPFPEVWHKLSDDRSAVDITTVDNLNKIIRVYVAEYLHLIV